MSKRYELVSLTMGDGCRVARLHDKLNGYDYKLRFWGYTKKEVIDRLRRRHDCVVRKGVC